MASTAWRTMRDPSDDRLPGVRGVFAVLLEPPVVEGPRHFVHLSWQGEGYVLRDFLQGVERKQGDDLPLAELWRAAKVRVPCKGRLRRSVDDYAFWRDELRRLTDESGAWASPPTPGPHRLPRPLGLAKEMGQILPAFFDPLPDDLLDAFDGKGS